MNRKKVKTETSDSSNRGGKMVRALGTWMTQRLRENESERQIDRAKCRYMETYIERQIVNKSGSKIED